MSVKLEFAEIISPLFLGRKNHGLKLSNTAGMNLVYDRTEKELLVTFNGKTAIVPSSNVASMTPVNANDLQTPVQSPAKLGRPVKAQASTPQDHVFSNGPGKTND